MPQHPYPPTAEELTLYYYGLPSLPKLVARSSTNVWQNPQRPGFTTFTGTYNMYPKILAPVGKHPLLHQLWNNAASSLRINIFKVIDELDWTAVDILRINLDEESQITLMIAVKPDTLSWNHGHPIVLRCKSLFEEHGIHDVHCEIRESVVSFLTGANPMPNAPAAFQLSSMPIIPPDEDYKADLTDCLGTRIATKQMEGIYGTKGLYLAVASSSSVNQEPTIVALTCRHVVIDDKDTTTAMQTYRQSEPFKDVIQIDQPTCEKRIESLTGNADIFRTYADKASARDNDKAAAENNILADSAMALVQAMKPYESPSSRVFGRVLYSPELRVTSGPGAAWLRDWALVELLPENHQALLTSIKNKVYIGHPNVFTRLVVNSEAGWKGLPEPEPRDTESFTIQLQQAVVPMDKILHPSHVADYNDEPAMLVAKYGARTGLTLGIGNTLKSFTRRIESIYGEREEKSEEWAITSAERADNRQKLFSDGGDSGSCVWDMEQRPAGILTAGSGMNGLNDVTYAQPLERLLADIKSHGFNVSLV